MINFYILAIAKTQEQYLCQAQIQIVCTGKNAAWLFFRLSGVKWRISLTFYIYRSMITNEQGSWSDSAESKTATVLDPINLIRIMPA